jgi:hypothetical protein
MILRLRCAGSFRCRASRTSRRAPRSPIHPKKVAPLFGLNNSTGQGQRRHCYRQSAGSGQLGRMAKTNPRCDSPLRRGCERPHEPAIRTAFCSADCGETSNISDVANDRLRLDDLCTTLCTTIRAIPRQYVSGSIWDKKKSRSNRATSRDVSFGSATGNRTRV